MTQSVTLCVPGTLGNITGPNSDGVLIGSLTATDPTVALVKGSNEDVLCITDDGGTYVDETTPINESTGDDVETLPATPAVDDAIYFGHATAQFNSLSVNQTTQGAGTWTITWQYWNGTAWANLSPTDGTAGFTAAAGWVDVTFTPPETWAQVPVDNVYGYWIRAYVSAYTSVSTAPQIGQGYVTVVSADVYTDELTDFTDAGAGDVPLLPSQPAVGDGIFVGYTEKFCKLKLTTSQARTGTATITLKYWDGSAWSALTTVEDDSVGWSATAGAHYIHFVPPTDWVANTAGNGPDGTTGYFISMTMTALTDVTQQPLLTQGWVYPVTTGALGVISASAGAGTVTVSMDTQTLSGSNADSVFLLVNVTQGTFIPLTFTKAKSSDSDTGTLAISAADQLALVQVTEDGSTELANVNFVVNY